MAMVLAAAFVVLGQAPIELKLQPPKGATYHYSMSMESSQKMAGMPTGSRNAPGDFGMSIQAKQTMRVLASSKSRTTLDYGLSDVKVKLPANSPMAGMKDSMASSMARHGTIEVDPQGKMIGTEAVPSGGMFQTMNPQTALGGVSYPKGPVKVGAKWSTKLDFSKLGQATSGMKISGSCPINFTLAESGTRGGKRAVRIDYTMVGTMAMAFGQQNVTTKLNGRGSSWVEVATGMLIESTATQISDIKMGKTSMQQTMKTTLKRQ